jgi:hypothetical protein
MQQLVPVLFSNFSCKVPHVLMAPRFQIIGVSLHHAPWCKLKLHMSSSISWQHDCVGVAGTFPRMQLRVAMERLSLDMLHSRSVMTQLSIES